MIAARKRIGARPQQGAGTMRYENKTFERETVNLDGNEFVGCHFIESRLILTAFDGVTIDRCTITRCDWVLDGPAENTILYLSAIYRGLGVQGQQLVEAIFDSIRRGTVGQDVTVPSLAAALAAQ
jgi:hypothetical protein